ncbi:MAG TPA: peptidylprolyl isomerase, partial [Candidatus Omnitrophota bacterium]|nr:peptidylprolyl isomerase [Candidatus Omnitrophota bacterium]
MKIKLETTKGNIIVQLYDKEMPITAGNFKKLAEKGFY